MIRILSPAPLFKVIPYGQSNGMERGVLGGGGDIPIWLVGRHLWSRGVSSYRTSSLTPGYSTLKMKTVILKKSLGRLEESRTPSQPGGVRDGESIRTHPVTLPLFERSSGAEQRFL